MRIYLFCGLLALFGSLNQLSAQYYEDEFVDEGTVRKDENKQPKERKPLKLDNCFVGSNFGLSLWNSFYADLSPYVGYRIKDVLAFGVGATYIYSYNYRFNFGQHVYGGRGFARLRPFRQGTLAMFYLHGEAEYLNMLIDNPQYNPNFPTPSVPQYIRFSAPAVHVGVGLTTEFGKGFGFTTEYLYNVFYQPGTSFYSSPLSFRMGVYYGF